MDAIQKAVKITRSKDTCERIQEFKMAHFVLQHENDRVGQVNLEGQPERGVCRAISRETMEGIWPDDFETASHDKSM